MEAIATNNYLVLRKIAHKITEGIQTSQFAQKASRWFECLSPGPGVPNWDGSKLPLPVEKGDILFVAAHGAETTTLPLGQGEVQVASISDALCRWKNNVLEPLGSLIEIRKVKVTGETKGGLWLPDDKKDPPSVSIVTACGKGWVGPSGTAIPMDVSPGDFVCHFPYRTMEVDLSPLEVNEKRVLIAHGDILCKLNVSEDERAALLELLS